MQQLLVAAFLLGLCINNSNAAEKPSQTSTMEISEKCHEDWQNIKEDTAKLAYYLKGGFKGIVEENDSSVKPSNYLEWLSNNYVEGLNKSTNLSYMPASVYMFKFVSEHYDELDKIFLEKYNETKDLTTTWKFLNRHLRENILKKSVGDFCKEMIERDAAKITLAKQGVYITSWPFSASNEIHSQNDTLVLDGYRMSEKEEDMQEVKNALEIVFKK